MGDIIKRCREAGNYLWAADFLSVNGSRLYGTHTDNSDTDYMGALIEGPEYLIGYRNFEQFEFKGDKEEGVVYSLRKFVKLVLEGNPTVLCTVFNPSPLNDALGVTKPEFIEMVVSRKAGPKFLGYMRSQMGRLESGSGMHVTRQDLINEHGYDSKYAAHILRLGFQGVEYMLTGRITLPMRGGELALTKMCRNGGMTYEDFMVVAEDIESELKVVVAESELPPEPQYDKINEWLVEVYQRRWSES